jgi:hypothetical protein
MRVGGAGAAELDRPPLPDRVEDRDGAGGEAGKIRRRGERGEVDQPVPGELGERRPERLERRALGDEEGEEGTVGAMLEGGARLRAGEEGFEQDLGTDPGGIALGESEERRCGNGAQGVASEPVDSRRSSAGSLPSAPARFVRRRASRSSSSLNM